jgi:hypothetical protein
MTSEEHEFILQFLQLGANFSYIHYHYGLLDARLGGMNIREGFSFCLNPSPIAYPLVNVTENPAAENSGARG